MAKQPQKRKLRTAVLVVHGMGSQRPLETVRGVIDAVWFDDQTNSGKKIWSHPEKSGVDIDLTVATTSSVTGRKDGRSADFHELYWAHLMSETRAVAVLLWLFELSRRGPRLKPAISPLYWATVIFLSLLILSVSLLAVQFALQFVERVPQIASKSFSLIGDSHSLISVILVIVVVASGLALIGSMWKGAFRLVLWSLAIAATAAFCFWLFQRYGNVAVPIAGPAQSVSETLTNLLLPILIAAAIVAVAMGSWGLAGLAISLVLSAAALYFVLIHFGDSFAYAYSQGWIPWSISSFWSSLAAFFFIALYFALYAAFLQPFLGDAARYFRNSPANVAVRREIRKQSVDTLERLHTSGDYDRIVVVAHSLGTVVAYDMLRAYYSRINQVLPRSIIGTKLFKHVDEGLWNKADARAGGREIVRAMHEAVVAARQRTEAGSPQPGDVELRAWLVTDFVTLGSPLTHALYLMCNGNSAQALEADFERRTREREFPTCPPRRLDGDKLVTFQDPNDPKIRYFHHGGLFALTRWTNLYFKVSQLFWGDAVGGQLAGLFGDPGAIKANSESGKNIADVQVWTNSGKADSFFSHVKYWTIAKPEKHAAPQIKALCRAVDLADTGEANAL